VTGRTTPTGPFSSGAGAMPRFRHLVGWVLRGGVVLAAILLMAGLILAYANGSSVSSPSSLTRATFAHTLASGGPSGLLLAGLLVLVLTPVARVALSCVSFALARDSPFVAITALVLSLLTGTIVVGFL